MIHYQELHCTHCSHNDSVKNGKAPNGTQRRRCKKCQKSFRFTYRYNACKPGIKATVIEMTLNGSGVRDTGRVLKISKDTVCSGLKKTLNVNPYFLTGEETGRLQELEVEIHFDAEADEFRSFAGNKSGQRRTRYATDRKSGIIPAWHNGKGKDRDFLILWNLLATFTIARYYTDDWGAYSKYIPAGQHRTGKDKTWKTERKNLNFRTHLKRLTRKSVCFSKNGQIHDNVIGMYIERFYYKTGTYGNN